MKIKKKKKQLFIIGVAAAAIAAAGILLYKHLSKSDDMLGNTTLAEISANSKLPDKEYSNFDFSNAVLNIPENMTSLQSYYRLKDGGIYTPEQCDEASWKLMFEVFGLDPNDLSTFTDREGNQPEAVAYSDANCNQVELYGSTYNDKYSESRVACVDNSEDANEDWIYREWYYMSKFTKTGGMYIQSFVSRDQTVQGDVVEEFQLDRGDEITDTQYLVNGCEYSPKQAIEFAEKALSHITPYLRSEEFAPTDVVVVKNSENDYYSYNILFEYRLDGIPMLDAAPPIIDYTESKYNFSAPVLVVSITEPDKIGGIFNLYAYTIQGDDGELEDKFISLEQAIDLMSEYFAPDYVQEISEVSIKYAIKYNLKETGSMSDDEKIYARPYWCFVNADSDHFDPGLYTRTETSILVDMQTGEIFWYDWETDCYTSSFDK